MNIVITNLFGVDFHEVDRLLVVVDHELFRVVLQRVGKQLKQPRFVQIEATLKEKNTTLPPHAKF
jgi:hypothetical protein